jgi:hypothetical protein
VRSNGSLLLSILVGIVVLVLVLKLLGAALKLFGIVIALALAVGVYFLVRGRIGNGGGRG